MRDACNGQPPLHVVLVKKKEKNYEWICFHEPLHALDAPAKSIYGKTGEE